MSFSGRLSSSDLQSLAFPRRELLSKFVAVAVAAVAKRSPKSPAPKNYPLPEFAIGDLVAGDWEFDEDEQAEGAPDSATDFGEILGMRWLPESESGLDAKTWVYFVRWTHTTIPDSSCYPCYDGHPTRECDLRLVSRA
ncbi:MULTISPECIES: hypothetical protein [unclassified Microcoleus]|uniref:hypothetical protein n=1 Tax=unclassified Microcoleus TaxID=2642155 RepID=UPI002FD246A5